MDSETRKAILEKQKKFREDEAIKAAKEREIAKRNRIEADWQSALFEASSSEHKGNLNIAWKPLPVIHESIYHFQADYGLPLVGLRLVGVGLTSLPKEVGIHLKSLQTLSLASNELTELPDTIVELTALRELNLLKNRLTRLPDRIGLMCSLTTLLVTNNCIESLPITFGALNLIQRVDLECNQIKVLPENLDHLLSCEQLIVNQNKLTYLPKCIARMPSLTSLSAARNELYYIPDEITTNQNIKILRLSSNKLERLPEHLGDLKRLKELCVAFNQIRKLPSSFYKLNHLTHLRVEGNMDLDEPSSEVINQGANAVVTYFKTKFRDNELLRMRQLILDMQNCFAQIVERNLADPSLFEPDTRIEGDGDLWYATQNSYLWEELIPALRKLWQAEKLSGQRPKGSGWIQQLPYDQKDIIWAFTNYSDSYGPVLTRQKAMFRRCACVDEQGRRLPCVPPQPGFMCYRQCTLFKAHLVSKGEKADRQWRQYRANGIKDAVMRAKHEAELYLNSVQGTLWRDNLAYEKAEELMLDAGADNAVKWRLAIAQRRKKAIIRKYDKRKARVQKIKDKKSAGLQAELTALKEQERVARDGYMRDKLTANINVLTTQLATMEETKLLLKLQRDCEEECELVDEEMYAEASSSSGEDDNDDDDESMPSSDDDSPEADEIRKRLTRKMRRKIRDKRLADQIREYRLQKHLEKYGGKAVQGISEKRKTLFSMLWDQVDGMMNPNPETMVSRRKLKKRFVRKLMQVIDVVDIRLRKIYHKAVGTFDEMQREVKHELYHQYVNFHVTEARQAAEREFDVIESVRRQWGGMGVAIVFKAWKHYYLNRKQRYRRDLREKFRSETIGFNAAMESIRLAQAQVDLWKKCMDVYTDTPFWVHTQTEEKTIDRPGIEHYLPPDFKMALPPTPLPEGISMDTSSDESEGSLERQRKTNDSKDLLSGKRPMKILTSTSSKSSKSSKKKKSKKGKKGLQRKSSSRSRMSTSRSGKSRSSSADEEYDSGDEDSDSSSDSEEESSGIEEEKQSHASASGMGTITQGMSQLGVSGDQVDDQGTHLPSIGATITERPPTPSLTTPRMWPVLGEPGSSANSVHSNGVDTGYYYSNGQENTDTWDYSQSGAWNFSEYGATSPNSRSFNHTANSAMHDFNQSYTAGADDDASAGALSTTSSAPGYDFHNSGAASLQGMMSVNQHQQLHQAEASMYLYGPDSLRKSYGRAAKVAKEYNQQLQEHYRRDGEVQYAELYDRVAIARDYMARNHMTLNDERPLTLTSMILKEGKAEVAAAEARKTEEFENSYRLIRRKRAHLSPVKHDMYLAHRHRAVAKAMPEVEIPHTTNMPAVANAEVEEDEGLPIKPTPEQLLKLAGGHAGMTWRSEAEGVKLRTILAHRALHAQEKLYDKAVAEGRAKPKSKSFFERNISVLFKEGLSSSSSESEGEEKAAAAKKKQRDRARAKRKLARSVVTKLGAEEAH